MKPNYIYFLIVFSIVLNSCKKDDTDIEPNEAVTFGIRHDKSLSDYEAIAVSSDPSRPDFSSTISFSYSLNGSSNYDYIASGVLIDSLWILTAGHNFYDSQNQTSPAPVSGIVVKVGSDPNNPDDTYNVAELIIHPTWLDDQQEFANANDLCLVKLSSAITDIKPAQLFITSNEAIGEDIWHCGYGDYSEQPGQNPNLDSKKHAIHNILDRSISGFQTTVSGNSYTGGLLAFDFDNPAETINTLGDNVVNSDENVLGSGSSSANCLDYEGTTVTGDSGGPLFLKDGSVWKVAGILSGGASNPVDNHQDSNYGDISIYIKISSAYNWIDSVIN